MNSLWADRSHEERTLLNPAFVALVLWHSATGFKKESSEGLPLVLSFLVPPLAMHPSTREALPKTVRTSQRVWLQEHPFLKEGFAARARSLAPVVREALGLAVATGVLKVEGSKIVAHDLAGGNNAYLETEEMTATFKQAAFLGRWFARAGDSSSIYTAWGVQP